MKYEMQVKISADNRMEWVSVCPTGGSPYQYDMREEARNELEKLYPDVAPENLRVIEVE